MEGHGTAAGEVDSRRSPAEEDVGEDIAEEDTAAGVAAAAGSTAAGAGLGYSHSLAGEEEPIDQEEGPIGELLGDYYYRDRGLALDTWCLSLLRLVVVVGASTTFGRRRRRRWRRLLVGAGVEVRVDSTWAEREMGEIPWSLDTREWQQQRSR